MAPAFDAVMNVLALYNNLDEKSSVKRTSQLQPSSYDKPSLKNRCLSVDLPSLRNLMRSSFGSSKSGSTSEHEDGCPSLQTSFSSSKNGSSSWHEDGHHLLQNWQASISNNELCLASRLSKMLEAHNAASWQRLSLLSITSAPLMQKEGRLMQEKSEAKAKESMQEMAKNQLMAQQRQAQKKHPPVHHLGPSYPTTRMTVL